MVPVGILYNFDLGLPPKKPKKPFFFFLKKKTLFPLIYVTSRAPILFKLGMLVVTFPRSIVRLEFLPPPSSRPNFFFSTTKISPPKFGVNFNSLLLGNFFPQKNVFTLLKALELRIFFIQFRRQICPRPLDLEIILYNILHFAPSRLNFENNSGKQISPLCPKPPDLEFFFGKKFYPLCPRPMHLIFFN